MLGSAAGSVWSVKFTLGVIVLCICVFVVDSLIVTSSLFARLALTPGSLNLLKCYSLVTYAFVFFDLEALILNSVLILPAGFMIERRLRTIDLVVITLGSVLVHGSASSFGRASLIYGSEPILIGFVGALLVCSFKHKISRMAKVYLTLMVALILWYGVSHVTQEENPAVAIGALSTFVVAALYTRWSIARCERKEAESPVGV